MYMTACVIMGIFGFVYFAMLDTLIPTVIFIAIAISGVPVMTLYGPEAALIAESFSPRLRYSGASLGYQLASVIAGGPAPFIATALFAAFHSSLPIAIYISICAVIGLVSTALLTDYTNKEIRPSTKAFEWADRAVAGLADEERPKVPAEDPAPRARIASVSVIAETSAVMSAYTFATPPLIPREPVAVADGCQGPRPAVVA